MASGGARRGRRTRPSAGRAQVLDAVAIKSGHLVRARHDRFVDVLAVLLTAKGVFKQLPERLAYANPRSNGAVHRAERDAAISRGSLTSGQSTIPPR
jgi:hypothetical protein